MMLLELLRGKDTGVSIGGVLQVDGVFQCYTLEPTLARKEFPGILPGKYRVTYAYSNRLKRKTLRLCDVPAKTAAGQPKKYRAGILIHAGNRAADSQGCIMPGNTQKVDWVGDSRKALAALEAKVVPHLTCSPPEEVWLVVSGPNSEPELEKARRI